MVIVYINGFGFFRYSLGLAAGFGFNMFLPHVGLFFPGCFLVAAGYLGCNKELSVAMVTLAVGWAGFALSGYQVNHLDIAPPFAGKKTWRGLH